MSAMSTISTNEIGATPGYSPMAPSAPPASARRRWPWVSAAVVGLAGIALLLTASPPGWGWRHAAAPHDATGPLADKLAACQMLQAVGDVQVRARGNAIDFDLKHVDPAARPEDVVLLLAEFGHKAKPLIDLDGTVALQNQGRTVYKIRGHDLGMLGDTWKVGGDPTEAWPSMLVDTAGKTPFPPNNPGDRPAEGLDAALQAWVGTPAE